MSSPSVVGDGVVAVHFDRGISPVDAGSPVVLGHVELGWHGLLKDNVGVLDVTDVVSKPVLDPVVREEVNIEDLDGEVLGV